MKIENSLDDTTEKLEAATVGLEDAEKQQLVNEEEVSALQRRFSLLDDYIARSDGRLQVESAKLAEAAAAAEAVEIQRKTLEGISFVNDERMDTLEEQIDIAREVALRSTRNAEEVARKLAMTQVDHERTTEKCKEAEVKCDELLQPFQLDGRIRPGQRPRLHRGHQQLHLHSAVNCELRHLLNTRGNEKNQED